MLLALQPESDLTNAAILAQAIICLLYSPSNCEWSPCRHLYPPPPQHLAWSVKAEYRWCQPSVQNPPFVSHLWQSKSKVLTMLYKDNRSCPPLLLIHFQFVPMCVLTPQYCLLFSLLTSIASAWNILPSNTYMLPNFRSLLKYVLLILSYIKPYPYPLTLYHLSYLIFSLALTLPNRLCLLLFFLYIHFDNFSCLLFIWSIKLYVCWG